MATLQAACRDAILTAEAAAKAQAARALAAAWRAGALPLGEPVALPERPARPARPTLALPRDVPRRKVGAAPAGRIALLHALAHIELNAIDLALDLVARFGVAGLPRGFFDDWLRVADEEGLHFLLLAGRLAELGAAYGDLPAHDGLWQAAEATAGDLLARLAVVPLVLEARGLDVTPAMIERLRGAGDGASADLLAIIYRDEIGHVAIGRRWFDHLAAQRGLEPEQAWLDLVRRHFKGTLKPPFNHAARAAAGLRQASYEALAR
jgi:uncharacterized ferritin-like protein (DUF455 family)